MNKYEKFLIEECDVMQVIMGTILAILIAALLAFMSVNLWLIFLLSIYWFWVGSVIGCIIWLILFIPIFVVRTWQEFCYICKEFVKRMSDS